MSTIPTPPAGLPAKEIIYLPTGEAYDKWSLVYDTDDNFLQMLDTFELDRLKLLQAVVGATLPPRVTESWNAQDRAIDTPLRIVDLGCGTGRNTVQLMLLYPRAQIVGLDVSPRMLEVARAKCADFLRQRDSQRPCKNQADRHLERLPGKLPRFETFDMLTADWHDRQKSHLRSADALISTLVMEHIPLKTFFGNAANMLRPGGRFLVTNMHSDMGAISQAGFVDAETGRKIRPESYVHGIQETIAAAQHEGLKLVGEVEDAAIEEDMVGEGSGKFGPRSRKWVGTKCWFYAVFVNELASEHE